LRALPVPIAAYLAAANAHDSEATAACFTSDAVVRDERREWRGLGAIKEWKEETDRKYNPITEVIDGAMRGKQIVVTARISGDFPGSPIELPYRFTLDGDKIALLEID
jgi:hypothetical protein